jgi:glycosyltransferase involved in cell wall biosynthesis
MWPTEQHPASGTFVRELVEGLRAASGSHQVFHIRSDRSKLEYIRAVSRIRSLLDKGNFDLVHAQYAHCAIVSALATRCVPVIAHFHGEFGYKFYRVKGDFRALKDLLKCRRDSLLASVSSRMVKGAIVVRNSDLERMHSSFRDCIPIGINSSRFEPLDREEACQKLGWEPGLKRILFPGDPGRPDKNYPLFKGVLDTLRSREVRFEEVHLHGIPHSSVPVLMNACDAMLLTSYTEASPTVVKEANFCNLPVVSVPVGDVQLQLRDVKPSYVCRPEKEPLADCVASVLSEGRRSNGRIITLDSWGIDTTVQKVLSFYGKVLGQSNAHPSDS